MLPLLKADFYQIRQRKGPIIYLTLVVLAVMGTSFVLTRFPNYIESVDIVTFGNKLFFGLPRVLNGLLLIFALFSHYMTFNNDVRNRTLINTVSFGYRRSTIFLEKTLLALLFSVVTITCIILALAISLMVYGVPVQFADVVSLFHHYLLPTSAILGLMK